MNDFDRVTMPVRQLVYTVPITREYYDDLMAFQKSMRPELERLSRMVSEGRRDLMATKKVANKKRKKGSAKPRSSSTKGSAPAAFGTPKTLEPEAQPTPLEYSKGWDDGARLWMERQRLTNLERQDRHDALEGILELIAHAHRTGGIHTNANSAKKD